MAAYDRSKHLRCPTCNTSTIQLYRREKGTEHLDAVSWVALCWEHGAVWTCNDDGCDCTGLGVGHVQPQTIQPELQR